MDGPIVANSSRSWLEAFPLQIKSDLQSDFAVKTILTILLAGSTALDFSVRLDERD